MTTFRPTDEQHALEAVQWAAASGQALEITGDGSKRDLGAPVEATKWIDTRGLQGVTLYEPAELVLTARAGTPLRDIKKLVRAESQHLAFEPPDLGPLLGQPAGQGTLGGTVACNLSGPRRPMAGALRDHLLGLRGVSGRGEIFKAGGRVVKNVTGFDLAKLMAGSFGTLALLTELTLKVLPRPETTRTLLIHGLDEATAGHVLTAALASGHDPSGAAHLPADLPHGPGHAVTALRLEGTAPSVAARHAALGEMLETQGEMETLSDAAARLFWLDVRDVAFFTGQDSQVWRLSVPPSQGAAVCAALRRLPGACPYMDWGGGLIWLSLPPSTDAKATEVRATLSPCGGHATLIRASAEIRKQVPVFHPQPAPLAALQERVRAGFDPRGILNPGRMKGMS
ncbi:FAD-binding protein [Magnetospira thiophila]